MTNCMGKHCNYCAICLSDSEPITCDRCRMSLVTQKLFDQITEGI